MDQNQQVLASILTDKDSLISLIQKLLTDLLKQTVALPRKPSPYDCKEIPCIKILDFLKRISKYSQCSASVLVAGLVYMDRLQERQQGFIINYFNIHKLLVTAIMAASKYLDDFYYKNQFYAKLGGITTKDINLLEQYLLHALNFSLFITQQEFQNYLNRIAAFQQINRPI